MYRLRPTSAPVYSYWWRMFSTEAAVQPFFSEALRNRPLPGFFCRKYAPGVRMPSLFSLRAISVLPTPCKAMSKMRRTTAAESSSITSLFRTVGWN